ncbi:MAG: hypothetical protein NVS4B7_13220 [Ktedonobacteraceae bacterium]
MTFDRLQGWLGMAHQAMQQFHDLPGTDLASIEDEQQRTDLPHRQAHDGA